MSVAGFFFLRMRAFLTDSAQHILLAVVALLVPAADALDHDDALGREDLFVALRDPLLQLEMGHHPLVFAVEVFGRDVDIGAVAMTAAPCFIVGRSPVGLYRGHEVARRSRRQLVMVAPCVDVDLGVG